MPTIRTYVEKSAKLALVICAAIFALIILFLVVFNFFPGNIKVGVFITAINFKNEIIITVLLAIVFYLGLKGYGVFKAAESPSQEFIKMTPVILVWSCIFIYAACLLGNLLDDTNCEHYNYNDKLNGGTKTINGKKYTVNLCGNGGSKSHFFGDGLDKVKLEILSEQGELLAKRYYSVFWDGVPGHDPIEVEQGKIIYYDDADEYDSQRNIAVPPTTIDWIRARLPY